MFIDSHVHLDVPQFDADRVEVIERARAADVEMFLEIAGSQISDGSLDAGLALTREYPFIYAAVGVHPHEASLYDGALEKKLLAMSEAEKVIGWGEIGLDYHYDNSPRETQRRVFRRQLELALDRDLPIIIHTRAAEDDTIEILRGSKAGTGVIHCFTGTEKLAGEALEMGFYISFSGVLTFKNAQDLREIARTTPIERLLIETDCPYLSPDPYRGKRNEPAFVKVTAAKLAEIRDTGIAEIARATTGNFKRLFRLQ
ncbi:MAG: TatD family hydrolase [Acidobacteria bacterium]|nr:TatD family hydrolase [Acidobacteriota bacterium]